MPNDIITACGVPQALDFWGAVTAENGAFGACRPPNFRERCKQLHGEGSERDVRSSDDDRFVHCLTTFFALRHLSIDGGASD